MWLQQLSDQMKTTLQLLVIDCVRNGQAGGSGINPYNYPSQVSVDLCLSHMHTQTLLKYSVL